MNSWVEQAYQDAVEQRRELRSVNYRSWQRIHPNDKPIQEDPYNWQKICKNQSNIKHEFGFKGEYHGND